MEDYSSSHGDSDDDTFEIEIPIGGELRPYDFEPIPHVQSTGTVNVQTQSGIDLEPSPPRIGNILWCTCGKCRAMETEEESICCRDENLPERYYDDKVCITENNDFRTVCLHREVLKTVLSMLNNMRGDEIDIHNKSFRYAGYRQYTWWIHNRLGRGVRKTIPSCAIWAIRDSYPEGGQNVYIPFQEARHEIEI